LPSTCVVSWVVLKILVIDQGAHLSCPHVAPAVFSIVLIIRPGHLLELRRSSAQTTPSVALPWGWLSRRCLLLFHPQHRQALSSISFSLMVTTRTVTSCPTAPLKSSWMVVTSGCLRNLVQSSVCRGCKTVCTLYAREPGASCTRTTLSHFGPSFCNSKSMLVWLPSQASHDRRVFHVVGFHSTRRHVRPRCCGVVFILVSL
jgi:hypothetical protein